MKSHECKLTIVTVSFNDAWALSKTIRSVAMQKTNFDVEYIVIDGGSSDSTLNLTQFWSSLDIVSQLVSEDDDGVYDAMNKGVDIAKGEYILFMNAGDVFYSEHDAQYALDVLDSHTLDGIIGWGMLKDQIWASWFVQTDAIRIASLGFCHQSLFLKRSWLLSHPFLVERGKTDSDTNQLADCILNGAKIKVEYKILALRGASDGISADLDLTRAAIAKTIKNTHSSLSNEQVQSLISFRRECDNPNAVMNMLDNADEKAQLDIAIMVLDTLYLRQAKNLDKKIHEVLLDKVQNVLWPYDINGSIQGDFIDALSHKYRLLRDMRLENGRVDKKNLELRGQLVQQGYLEEASGRRCDVNVSLTTFPARVRSLRLVLDSLLSQSVRPNKVSLVVGRDEFKNQWQFPKEVYELIGDRFQIVFVEKTAHQYDKFLHSWQENEGRPFVIVDDDVVYPPQSLEKLVLASEKYPDCVIANRSHRISLCSDGQLLPYTQWEREVENQKPSHDLFPTGAGGVLYPKGFLRKCVSEREILANCPYADDIWLKAMSLLHDVKVKSSTMGSNEWKLGYSAQMKDLALHEGNVEFGLNDVQLKRSFDMLTERALDWRTRLRA